MLTCHIQGGLGNQLFQIFYLISTAIRYKTLWYIVPMKVIGSRPSYWTTIFQKISDKYRPGYLFPINTCPEEYICRMDTATIEMMVTSTHTVLTGYFQDYRYFEGNYKEIIEMLGLVELKHRALSIYYYPYSSSTSIHFRYGDYKQLSTHYNILEYEYYRAALYHIVYHDTGVRNVIIFYEKNLF